MRRLRSSVADILEMSELGTFWENGPVATSGIGGRRSLIAFELFGKSYGMGIIRRSIRRICK